MTIITYVGGCGRLGLSLAVWSAYKGFKVIAADIDAQAVTAVNKGKCPISETGVAELLPKVRQNLFATTNIELAVAASDITFVIVPTPSCQDGSFSLEYIFSAIDEGVAAGVARRHYPLVVIVSTINPGDTRKIADYIEQKSGKVAFDEFHIAYSPEFIRQGSTMYDFANPDIVLMGASSHMAVYRLTAYYEEIVDNSPQFFCLTPESAEIAKIAINAYLGTKIHFANQIMWLCQHTRFSDAKDVLAAVGADRRIGHQFLKPGLWPGGPCLPRDGRALVRAIRNTGKDVLPVSLAAAADSMVFDACWAVCELLEGFPGTIGILGLTYKTDVDITEESPGVMIARELNSRWKRRVIAYDSRATVTGITHAVSMQHLVKLCDVLVIATPWPEFKSLRKIDLGSKDVIDCWGLLDPKELNARQYMRLGEGT